MKNFFYFIAGVCFITLISATTVSIMTVKPMTPKVTIVEDFRTTYGLEKEMKHFIQSKVKEGFVVKSTAMMDDESTSKGIVVLEKY